MKLKGNPCVSLPAVLINMGCFVKGGLCEVTVSKVICLYCITMDRKKSSVPIMTVTPKVREKVDLEEFKMKTGKKPHQWKRVFFIDPG